MASLIIAYSARALAAAAARAGEPVVVIDWFADDDTRELAQICIAVPPGDDGAGFAAPPLDEALDRLDGQFERIVYGAGIEGDPALLARLQRSGPVTGNGMATLALVKNPSSLAELLARLDAAHPEISLEPPQEMGWLVKRTGASGGGHVAWADVGLRDRKPGYYYQRAVTGEAVSVLFAANGKDAVVLGFSQQWTAPTSSSPFRYGGCVGPIALADGIARDLMSLCRRVSAASGLVGLNGLDCLITEDGAVTVIEINPRPGAAIDLFNDDLWTIHVRAAAGFLPSQPPPITRPCRAASVLYADHAVIIPPAFDWPAWTADRSSAGTAIAKGAPTCTVFAEADTPSSARALLEIRCLSLYKRLIDANTSHTDPSVAV